MSLKFINYRFKALSYLEESLENNYCREQRISELKTSNIKHPQQPLSRSVSDCVKYSLIPHIHNYTDGKIGAGVDPKELLICTNSFKKINNQTKPQKSIHSIKTE